MSLLALDLGTTTGWAWCLRRGEPMLSGTWSLKNTRFQSHGIRFVKLRENLDRWHQLHSLKTIWFEEVRRHMGTDAAHAYGGYLATMQAWCVEHDVEYRGASVQAIKKFWTGRGNADKQAMLLECEKRKITVQDDNQADAVALLHLATEGSET